MVLVAAAVVLGRAEPGGAVPTPMLYAVTGAGGASSTLYTLDPSTAAETPVGAITVNASPISHVTGLAIDPSSGQMYAAWNSGIANTSTLLSVDKTTGAATVIGTQDGIPFHVSDMAFSPVGPTLYAWAEPSDDDAYTLDTSTGAATLVGECGCNTFQTGLSVNSHGQIFMKSNTDLFRISHVDGLGFGDVALTGSAASNGLVNVLAFGPSDALYTGNRTATGFDLDTIDLSNGSVSNVGTNTVTGISAITWDLSSGFSAPPQADLSLQKSVDDSNPSGDWGVATVTFTLTVSNDGPNDATGVLVHDALPAGFSYVSDDGSGAYDSSTGTWTVGTVTNGNSATLDITATIEPTNAWTNSAEVVSSDAFDPDSETGSGEGDTFATQAVTPVANPSVDASASVDVNGPTKTNQKKKSFTVFVNNVGTASFNLSSSDVDVEVNSSTTTVSCDTFSTTLAPGKSKKFRCTWSPAARGITSGTQVTYTATVNIPTDGFANNDTGTLTVTAS
jgi:uncharacterized repeat protein (TIGR01451 family)